MGSSQFCATINTREVNRALITTGSQVCHSINHFIKNWIIGKCNSRLFIGLAILVYEPLYNNPSYSRILVGSRLWSIRGQTHRWRQLSIHILFEFWIWTNQNSLLSIATNQFASFCMDIRSHQCYFRLSKWRNLI